MPDEQCWMGSLEWRYNGHDSVSNHQPHDCLLNHLFRRRSTKTSKLRVTGLCAGNSPETGAFPTHIWPVTRKMIPFDDVIMRWMHPWRTVYEGILTCCTGCFHFTMTSWHAFSIYGPLGEKSSGHRWFPPQRTVMRSFDVQTMEMAMIWHAITLMWRHCNGFFSIVSRKTSALIKLRNRWAIWQASFYMCTSPNIWLWYQHDRK